MRETRFPAEAAIADVRRSLAANRCVVVSAPPGSGKTTCIPPALLGESWLEGRKIVMLEPRRIAARSCAEFIASKLGCEPGGTVGYRVRLESKVSKSTRLEIVTEGLLAQRLVSDPELSDTALVIFDEFHERSLQCDLAFAMALDSRRALRPDLRIAVMSATLDEESVAAHIGDADVVRAEGRMFPVETRYLGDVSVPAAVARAVRETGGDILCFLPGEGEIRRAAEALGDIPGCAVLPLYGNLPKEAQDLVFRPCGKRKIILSTSIAETSVTIPGITCVVDSGLMRVPRFSPSTGMDALTTLPLSLDRAEQRRGRAGRVRPGVCYRLWDQGSEISRSKRMAPEILSSDLCPAVMASAAWGAYSRDALPWPTAPGAAAWDRAAALLKELGALDGDGRLTDKGAKMASIPAHPRLAAMLLAAATPEAAETAAMLAAIIEEGGAKSRETDIRKIADETRETPRCPSSRRILRLAARFSRLAPAAKKDSSFSPGSPGALLALAYPDRIGKNRGNATFRMTSGRGAFLERTDAMARSPYLVCCDLDDRPGDAKIFLACPVEEKEIESLFAHRLRETARCEWDRREERVANTVELRLGEMVLREKPAPESAAGAEATARCLLSGVRQKGVSNMPCWTPGAVALRERAAFLHRELGWPDVSDGAILASLEGFVQGVSRWKDLGGIDMCAVIDSILAADGKDRRRLDALAPERFEVPSGSRIRVRYDSDSPHMDVRLQECFGMMDSPTVAGGRVKVAMTLLSPAQRPVQTTKDLAGFWSGAYSLVRKEMRGRYPKHYWPENPFEATATRRVRPGEREAGRK